MPRLIWSEPGSSDLRRLRAFLHDKNPRAASRAAATIRKAPDVLRRRPEAGRRVPGLPADVRELIITFGTSGGYVARYRPVERGVVIAGIRHGRERDFKAQGDP